MTSLRAMIGVSILATIVGTADGGVLRLAPETQEIDSGAPFVLRMFFDERPGDFGSGSLNGDVGLFTAAARILVDVNQFGLVTVDSVATNPQFDFEGALYPGPFPFPSPPPTGFANLAGFSEAALQVPPVEPTNGEILLATFTMRVTAPIGTTVLFTPSQLDPPIEDFLGDRGTVYDDTLGDPLPASVTVTGVIPEPGSMLIWAGLVGAPLLVRRRRCKLVAKA